MDGSETSKMEKENLSFNGWTYVFIRMILFDMSMYYLFIYFPKIYGTSKNNLEKVVR